MAKWALVKDGKVVDVHNTDPTGLFHESFSVLPAPDDAYVGQDVDDDGKFIAKVSEGSLPDEVVVKDSSAPSLTAEEIAEAVAKAQAALPDGMELDLADRHVL